MRHKHLEEKLEKLIEKYSTTGQDISSYLEGLLYSDYLSYWDYINLDTLLTLQAPKTDFPDENIFIIYHQITELYFKLIIEELKQISNNGKIIKDNGQDLGWNKKLSFSFLKERLERIIRYMKILINSFDIMIEGMTKQEFTKFRMSLLPGSGFQSAQFRIIEIYSTSFKNLSLNNKSTKTDKNIIENFYWSKGATEIDSGKKTYTLTQFQKKYSSQLISLTKKLKKKNLWEKFKEVQINNEEKKEIINLLKEYDLCVNVKWKLAHFKSAVKYLKASGIIKATGGTNWQKYLPPRFQKIIFFPQLWTKEEKKEWGISWLKKL
ncbi:MAG: tryptophan 2,3-dioxygenase [Flavobacteriales bacterium]|nr:tryptophan 2,3-dioxygenase [Flavobacteriales bacterium]|tara:strand:+ start:75863 stop:76828 length:966 start_codon:yes stop_codon:yes gene_type:complete